MSERRVLVVGGGIAGLAAANQLVQHSGVEVEVWEAGHRLGGKIATSPFAGLADVDEAADAYLTRVPHAAALARRVGIGPADTTSPTGARAAVWHDGLHDIPGELVLGIPAGVRAFAATGLLSWRGKLRAALEPMIPSADPDDSLGRLVRHRFGDEVHDRLVDALVGSIYATDTARFSLAAVPQLAALTGQGRSLLLAGRAQRRRAAAAPSAEAPIFGAPRRGMGALVDATAAAVIAAGGVIRTGRPASGVAADGAGWRIDDERFDAVVLACPAAAAARLLATCAPEPASGLAATEVADVIMVRLAIPAGDWPARLAGRSGYLVPKSRQRHVTAASFASQKWAHWRPADGTQIVRASLGRDGLPVADLDDEQALRVTLDEVGGHLGFTLAPTATSVTRWTAAFPQYRPHHAERVAAIEAALPAGIVLAGASYRGIGIPACIADGERAAAALLALHRVPAVKDSPAGADAHLS